MFRNTKEQSSGGGEHLCLAKVTCVAMVLVHVVYVLYYLRMAVGSVDHE